MVVFESSSSTETILTSCFELRFSWHEDRWKHEIVSTMQAQSLPRIASLEATTDIADQTRVVSPTYQQIHLEQDKAKGTVRAFLVGQSGPHHFSAAFKVEERPHGAVIDVDVADRCLSPVDYLAATYTVELSTGTWTSESHVTSDPDAATDPAVAARTALVLTCEHPHSRLIFEADAPARHSADEFGHGVVRIQALSHLLESNQTHRFRYRWRWVNDPNPGLWDRSV